MSFITRSPTGPNSMFIFDFQLGGLSLDNIVEEHFPEDRRSAMKKSSSKKSFRRNKSMEDFGSAFHLDNLDIVEEPLADGPVKKSKKAQRRMSNVSFDLSVNESFVSHDKSFDTSWDTINPLLPERAIIEPLNYVEPPKTTTRSVWDTVNSRATNPLIVQQAKDLSEAMYMIAIAERAARKIQLAFRERQAELNGDKSDSDTVNEDDSVVQEKDEEEKSEATRDAAQWYTLIFLVIVFLVQWVPKILKWLNKCLGDEGTGDVDAAANLATQPGGGGGGGGTGPTPTGGEGAGAGAGGAQAGAQGAMAAQAASSAASGAASGVASGAAAGAAASSAAAAGAAAAGTAAAAGGAQVATVVAVSTAAAAAATSGILSPTVVEPIMSMCGIVNPDVRTGRFTMNFEGFPRVLDDRESTLLGGLVKDAYNDITLGKDYATVGCLDPLAREMQSISVVNQTLLDIAGPPMLELVFQADLLCDRCSPSSPLFSEDQLALKEEDTTGTVNGTNSTATNSTATNTTANNGNVTEDETQIEQSRWLLGISFDSQEFFQTLIQKVIFETEELTDVGKLPEGFTKVAKAWVVTTGSDDSEAEEELVTEVQYERRSAPSGSGGGGGGSGGVFQFAFVNPATGETEKVTVAVTEEGEVAPITAFPTFEPSHRPTTTPSSLPTGLPSIQPSNHPSTIPSSTPTDLFSGQPTNLPSVKPSAIPSDVPSDIPSDSPSDVPSVLPSMIPSYVPSESPSYTPSYVPSMIPSYVPSTTPSDVPSYVPSESPSDVPSYIPSDSPSYMPSEVPSRSPSDVPSSRPSASPSKIPTMSPSKVPSPQPTPAPTPLPTPPPTPRYDYGCNVDSEARIFGYLAANTGTMTVSTCRSMCRGAGYYYAGLQVGSECWCANSWASTGGTGCDVCCQGGCDGQCGGAWRMSIYWSGL